jgi:hypothetical protein
MNMGNFESTEIMATVTIEPLDLFTEEVLADMDPDELMTELKKAAEQYLDQNLDPELKEAAKLSQADKSMLFDNPPARPARREKTRNR